MTASTDTAPQAAVERLASAASQAGASLWEAYVVRSGSLAVAAKDGAVDQVRRKDELAGAVRLVEDGRLGFAYTSDFSSAALEKLASQALAGARLSDPLPGLDLPEPPAGPYPETDVFDPEIAKVSQREKQDRVLAMEAAARDMDPRVERVRSAEYREVEFSVWLVNSRGLEHHHSGTLVSGSLMVKAAQGDQAEMGFEGDFSRTWKGLDLISIGRGAAMRAVMVLDGRPTATGRAPVILENRVASEFLGVLAGSFLAENVHKGKSMLAGRDGEKVMSDLVTIVDDGLYPGGAATSPADDEGVPRQKTVLVDRGRLSGFLYDLTRARVDGRQSTGNAGRSVKSPPGVSPSNLFLTPGAKSLDELCADLDTGLLVTEAMGVHTADPISGDFSLGVSGVWFSGGRPQHPVKGVALAGNLLTMLGQVRAVGSDLRLFGSIGAPSLTIDGLTVSGR